MLSEAFKYLTTPCSPHLKSMGYLKELIALEARFKRCQAAWHPHIQKSKSVICDAANNTTKTHKVVVLGSGILSDIPIEMLSKTFETVVLVDICFLKQTRERLSPYDNVEWQTADVTGIAGPLYNWVNSNKSHEAFPVPTLPIDISLGDADLVISSNLLSQLPLIPLQFLSRAKPDLDEKIIVKFAQDIVRAHLEFLDTCPGSICLISEIERQICDGPNIQKIEDPLWGQSLAHDGDEWFWHVAPKSEISSAYEIRNRVIGSHWLI